VTGLIDASELARLLGTARSFIYEHATELGAIRLGSGPRARLRFDPERALERLATCSAGRGSDAVEHRTVEPKRGRRRSSRLGTEVPLLPIRGDRSRCEPS
jgi:hypothetical protein